jgi:hypothetical protein
MEKQLKTLKDLKDKLANHIIEEREFIPEAEFVSVKELKQEAIKWVKELDKDINLFKYSPEAHQKIEEYKEVLTRTSNQILWIKHFFNLTEEELK